MAQIIKYYIKHKFPQNNDQAHTLTNQHQINDMEVHWGQHNSNSYQKWGQNIISNINYQLLAQLSIIMNPNISSSSLSDASQVRYQKAVKQIGKLIGVNNTIKRDAENFRIMCENLQLQNAQLFHNFQQINNDKRFLQQKLQEYQNSIKQLQTKNKQLQKKQQSLFSNSMVETERQKNRQQITILNDKLNEQGNNIIHLEERIAQLQKENKDLNASLEKSMAQVKNLSELSKKEVQVNDCVKCPEYLRKMNQAIQYRMIVQQQLVLTKKKLYAQANQEEVRVYGKNRDIRDQLIFNLEDKIRITQQKYKKKKIQLYKTELKFEKLLNQGKAENHTNVEQNSNGVAHK